MPVLVHSIEQGNMSKGRGSGFSFELGRPATIWAIAIGVDTIVDAARMSACATKTNPISASLRIHKCEGDADTNDKNNHTHDRRRSDRSHSDSRGGGASPPRSQGENVVSTARRQEIDHSGSGRVRRTGSSRYAHQPLFRRNCGRPAKARLVQDETGRSDLHGGRRTVQVHGQGYEV